MGILSNALTADGQRKPLKLDTPLKPPQLRQLHCFSVKAAFVLFNKK